jgi:hypothetical protein
MLQIRKKRGFVKYTIVYNANQVKKSLKLFSLYLYEGLEQKNRNFGFYNIKRKTLLSDLRDNEEKILSKFKSNVRNEINRAKRDGCVTIYNVEPEFFLTLYNKFATLRNIATIPIDDYKAFGENLMLSAALYDKECVAYHAYIMDKEASKVILLHSGTNRLENKDISVAMIGRANRFLHYQDMLYFKDKGFVLYDWGGVVLEDNDEYKGIDEFKLSFGGELKETFSSYSFLYWWLLKIVNTFRNIKLWKK